jgi:hypothetical protein
MCARTFMTSRCRELIGRATQARNPTGSKLHHIYTDAGYAGDKLKAALVPTDLQASFDTRAAWFTDRASR